MGWLSGRLRGRDGLTRWTGSVGPDPKKNSDGKMIFRFQLSLDFWQELRNSTRRFRRNLDIGTFHKSF
jgi:hypothetical protein